MFRKILSIMLSGLLLSTAFISQTAGAQTTKQAASTVEQARSQAHKIGVGQKARVEVKMRDNTKLKGYISAAGEDSFTVTDRKTGAATNVSYADVAQLKKHKGGLSPLTWGIIGGAAVTTLIVAVTVIQPILCDGGAGC